jgi:tetratricopeptide (TPR) repeat protein
MIRPRAGAGGWPFGRVAAVGLLLVATTGCPNPPQQDAPAAPVPMRSSFDRGDEHGAKVLRLLAETSRSGSPLALLELALYQQRSGDAKACFATLRKLARKHPEFPRGRHYLGLAYLTLGRPAEARAEFEAETRLAPKDADARVHLGMALQALRRPSAAAAEYRVAQELDPKAASPYFALAQLDRGPAGYAGALRNLEKFIARTANPAAGYHLMAQIHAHKGEHDTALKYEKLAVERDPGNASYWHYLGAVHHGFGKPESLVQALQAYDRAAGLRPHDPRIWFDMGRARAASHAWPEAIGALQRAQRLDAENPDVAYQMAQALRAVGRTLEANEQLERYRTHRRFAAESAPIRKEADRRPDAVEPRLRLAEVAIRLGQYRAAQAAIKETLPLRPASKEEVVRAQRLVDLINDGLAREGAETVVSGGPR